VARNSHSFRPEKPRTQIRGKPAPEDGQAFREELEAARQDLEVLNQELGRINLGLEGRVAALERSNELAGATLESLPVAAAMLTAGLKVARVNRCFCDLFGASPPSALGRPLAEVAGADWNIPILLTALTAARERRRELTDFEFELGVWGRGPRMIAVTARPLLRLTAKDGQALLACCFDDLTEHKRRETQLARRLELLGNASIGLLMVDADGNISYANHAARDLIGHELVGMSIESGLRLPPGTRLAAAVRQARRETGESAAANNGAEPIAFHWDTTPLLRGQRAIGAALELRSLAAETQIRNTLLESEKFAAAGRLAATLAHEIMNPLGAVGNALYLLQSAATLDDDRRRWVDTAAAELQRAVQIVRGTLGLYREPAAPTLVDPNQTAVAALDSLGPLVRQKQLRIDYRLQASHKLLVQEGDLRQLFANLLANAADAAPAGGCLRVASYDADNGRPGVRLLIGDNGPGIPTQLRERIFRPFITTKGAGGTGLGLWVANEIARKYQGEIQLKSWVSPPTGTCFAVTFPAG
jgi:signal transduction histidine kinase